MRLDRKSLHIILAIRNMNDEERVSMSWLKKRLEDLEWMNTGSDDELLSECEVLREGGYIDFSIRRYAGNTWSIVRPLKLTNIGRTALEQFFF